MLKFFMVLLSLTACSKEAADPVPIMQVVGNPLAYEGKTFITCGSVPAQNKAFLYTGDLMGRSPIIVRLDRPIASKSGCIEARLVRFSGNAANINDLEPVGTAFDGPYAPKHWQLKVISVDPR